MGAGGHECDQRKQNQHNNKEGPVAASFDLPREQDGMGQHFHTTSQGCICTEVAVPQGYVRELLRACNQLNKRRLSNMLNLLLNPLSVIMRPGWAFCHRVLGEMPQSCNRYRTHLHG